MEGWKAGGKKGESEGYIMMTYKKTIPKTNRRLCHHYRMHISSRLDMPTQQMVHKLLIQIPVINYIQREIV